jgi:hypothetical protein
MARRPNPCPGAGAVCTRTVKPSVYPGVEGWCNSPGGSLLVVSWTAVLWVSLTGLLHAPHHRRRNFRAHGHGKLVRNGEANSGRLLDLLP